MKKLITIALALCLIACLATASAATKLVIGASAVPHAVILEAAQPLLAEKGIDLEIVIFDDYVQPNLQLDAGDLDANYFQHIPYLDTFNAENGTHLVSVLAIHCEPFGIYPGTKSAIADLADGDQIAIPNDGSNRARALLLLEAQGLIKMTAGVGMQATVLDIIENPLNLEIVEMEAAQIANVRDSVALALINGNYAMQAGLFVGVDAIAAEDAEIAKNYENILVVKEGNENNEKIQALIKAFTSDTVKNYINETYPGSVVPCF